MSSAGGMQSWPYFGARWPRIANEDWNPPTPQLGVRPREVLKGLHHQFLQKHSSLERASRISKRLAPASANLRAKNSSTKRNTQISLRGKSKARANRSAAIQAASRRNFLNFPATTQSRRRWCASILQRVLQSTKTKKTQNSR